LSTELERDVIMHRLLFILVSQVPKRVRCTGKAEVDLLEI